jgi:Superinfection immunity protein/GYF domain 2
MRLYLHRHGKVEGPFTVGQLRSMWDAGTINGAMSACEEGSEDWNQLEVFEPMFLPQPARAPGASHTLNAANTARANNRAALAFLVVLVLGPLLALVATGNVNKFFKTVVSAPDMWLGVVVVTASIAFYFLPALIASRRNTVRRWAIALLNLFFGWTIIGYIAAFIWACVDQRE